MTSALIVTSNEKRAAYFKELLSKEFDSLEFCESGYGARNRISEAEFKFILIDSPLCDEPGHDLAAGISLKSSAGIVLLVRGEHIETMESRLSEFGIFIVEKPISKTLFLQAMKLATIGSNRFAKLRNENNSLQERIEELRIVDRAKIVLVQCLKMTEEQAHRYIEKQAMDLRLSRREVAKNILTTYES